MEFYPRAVDVGPTCSAFSQVTEGLRELGLFGLQIPEEYGGLVRGSVSSGLPPAGSLCSI